MSARCLPVAARLSPKLIRFLRSAAKPRGSWVLMRERAVTRLAPMFVMTRMVDGALTAFATVEGVNALARYPRVK